MRTLEVLATGPLALFCDLGRPGLASMGVSGSGAADRAAYLLGQRLLGHDEPLAAIEVTLGGLALRAREAFCLVLTGADPQARVDGRPAPANAPLYMLPGQELRLGVPARGLRSYLGVRGGFDVTPVLGSRSSDLMSGVGPGALAAGDELRVSAAPMMTFAGVDVAPVAPLPDADLLFTFVPGPRDDWFADLRDLTDTTWAVSSKSNRIGVRLHGTPLRRHPDHTGELPTEGAVRGAIQVPTGGEPVVFLNDHPVTGGYPVIGVLTRAACDVAAQARPGDRVRFRRA